MAVRSRSDRIRVWLLRSSMDCLSSFFVYCEKMLCRGRRLFGCGDGGCWVGFCLRRWGRVVIRR